MIELLVISVLTKVGLVLCEVELLDGFPSVVTGNDSRVKKEKIRRRLLMLISAVV